MAAARKGRGLGRERMVLRLTEQGGVYSIRQHGESRGIPLDGNNAKAIFAVVEAARHGHQVSVIEQARDLTPNQAAAHLGVSRPFLRAQMEAGRLPFHQVGTHYRIRWADCEAFGKILVERDDALQRLADLGQSIEGP
jgi:excisionase family DNA binding protein